MNTNPQYLSLDTARRQSKEPEGEREPPQPLMRELPPAEAFPIDALGDILGPAAVGIQQRVQSPLAMCGQSVLAAATLAVQAHADVLLPTGQTRPLSNLFLTVAASGERKSATDTEALGAIRRRETELRETFDREMPAYVNDNAAWERMHQQICKKHKDRAALRAALDELGPAPRRPLDPVLLCSDPTFEGLCLLLGTGQPSIGVFTAEGGQFIGGHAMKDDAKLRTAAGLSSIWDGEPIKRVRAGNGAVVLPGRRVSMHLMAQPDVAAMMLADPVLIDQGLLSRCLIAAPEPTSGFRPWRDPCPKMDEAIRRYDQQLLRILRRPLPLVSGKTNELAPRVLRLSDERARAIYIAFYNEMEVQLKPNGALTSIRGLANKLAEHAARIAAVLTLIDDIDAQEIPAHHMASGTKLAQYYAAEAIRLFEVGRTDPDLKSAQQLLDWMHKSKAVQFSLTDIYQRGPRSIRNAKTARRLVSILVAHRHLEEVQDGVDLNGVRRKEVWRLTVRA
jgi:hypothetical protein